MSVTAGRESREVTLGKARQRFVEVGSQLRLGGTLTDMAHKFYSMALDQGITRGRRAMTVVASCLYIACRLENVHLLLLDFSDAVQVRPRRLDDGVAGERLRARQGRLILLAQVVHHAAAHRPLPLRDAIRRTAPVGRQGEGRQFSLPS